MRSLGLAALSLLIALLPLRADAHRMPQSMVVLDFQPTGVGIELILPLDRLEIGFGRPLTADPVAAVARHRAALAAYIARHLSLTAPDGRPWMMTVGSLALAPDAVAPELTVRLEATPPTGAPSRRFTLHDDVIVHQLVTHQIVVAVGRDWTAWPTTAEPEMLGLIDFSGLSLEIDRPVGPGPATMAGIVALLLGGFAQWERGRRQHMRRATGPELGRPFRCGVAVRKGRVSGRCGPADLSRNRSTVASPRSA